MMSSWICIRSVTRRARVWIGGSAGLFLFLGIYMECRYCWCRFNMNLQILDHPAMLFTSSHLSLDVANQLLHVRPRYPTCALSQWRSVGQKLCNSWYLYTLLLLLSYYYITVYYNIYIYITIYMYIYISSYIFMGMIQLCLKMTFPNREVCVRVMFQGYV